ncbi:UNVERIFIED_CONTAM: hypothetical protein FKN15_013581 [Acipenser sinensis]
MCVCVCVCVCMLNRSQKHATIFFSWAWILGVFVYYIPVRSPHFVLKNRNNSRASVRHRAEDEGASRQKRPEYED